MEFYVELFLTALISVLLAYLIGKIAAADNVDDEDLAADKPAPPPLSADSGPPRMESTAAATATAGLGMGLGASQEEETGKSSGDACASGVVPGATDRPETGVTDVEKQRLDEKILDSGKAASGFDLQKQDTILGADESSSNIEGSKLGIGIIGGDLDEVEPNVDKEVREVVEMGGEDTLQRDDARAVTEETSGSLLHGEDEWEGIERSELEKLFGVATEFVGSEKGGDAVSKLSNELQMQLYGLHRVATEGPCYEPQPMALKVTARAKWHAWQSLGNMNPDAAMEKYISLLTKSIPGWMGEKSGEEARGHDDNDPSVVQVSGIGQHCLKTSSCCNPETESGIM
ncbi:Acyl CoA binding protein [Musa troglodytarum]|uniref:Acyl CoA binding protein n=1 Tax=Musa troglodytarum TaxID=320322 RepID=A0A9E7EAP8_9LILI|nr:Acyl CoA binding protein [Musa troglodytarum]URD73462.1 Acyl CoA binding protein [Musa troglodytarum]URD73464.1 Acyl CoA binding protein [Musa troglodytarum]